MKKKSAPTKYSKYWRTYLRYILILLGIGLFLFFLYTFVIKRPSNNRNWETGFEKLSHVTINGNTVTITNIHNSRYAPDKTLSSNYAARTVHVKDITAVWFVVEPFKVLPNVNFKGVAHTYFVFDLKNDKPIVVSVEARREKGEKYSAFRGIFNIFDLIYVWGNETDITIRRAVVQHNTMYMYPLTISQASKEQLFLQMAKRTQELETHPRFYNTLTSNCTNELAKTANRVKPNAIPLNIALFLPAYSVDELYKLGFIRNDLSLSELQKKYYISTTVSQLYADPNFSEKLRASLASK